LGLLLQQSLVLFHRQIIISPSPHVPRQAFIILARILSGRLKNLFLGTYGVCVADLSCDSQLHGHIAPAAVRASLGASTDGGKHFRPAGLRETVGYSSAECWGRWHTPLSLSTGFVSAITFYISSAEKIGRGWCVGRGLGRRNISLVFTRQRGSGHAFGALHWKLARYWWGGLCKLHILSFAQRNPPSQDNPRRRPRPCRGCGIRSGWNGIKISHIPARRFFFGRGFFPRPNRFSSNALKRFLDRHRAINPLQGTVFTHSLSTSRKLALHRRERSWRLER